jgi:hypothetical protein
MLFTRQLLTRFLAGVPLSLALFVLLGFLLRIVYFLYKFMGVIHSSESLLDSWVAFLLFPMEIVSIWRIIRNVVEKD